MPKPPTVTTDRLPVACFAPALSDEALSRYQALAESQPRGALRDALLQLLRAVLKWWELPGSARKDVTRFSTTRAGRPVVFEVQPLEDGHVAALDEHLPWPHEVDAIQALLDAIPPEQKPLRDCAFHLLWHVKELCEDREPLTDDRLPQ